MSGELLAIPLLATNYFITSIMIPFMIYALAAIGPTADPRTGRPVSSRRFRPPSRRTRR